MRRLARWVRHRAPYLFIVAMMSVVLAVQSGQINDLRQVQRDQKTESVARIAAVEAEATARLVTSCESGNEFRSNDLASWEYILRFAPQTEQAKTFHKFLIDKDQLRDCKNLTKGTP